MKQKPIYLWDNQVGVCVKCKGAYNRQAIQLVGGTKRFRIMAGKMLVDALNKEAGK